MPRVPSRRPVHGTGAYATPTRPPWQRPDGAGTPDAGAGTSRLFLTYEDTVLDLALSTGGAIVGAAIVAFLLRPRRSERSRPPPGRSSPTV